MNDPTKPALAGKSSADPAPQPSSSGSWQEHYAHSLGIQAYIYGFPWIYNTQLRWLWATPEGEKVSANPKNPKPNLYAPINTFHHAQQPSNPTNSTSGGSPNCDTLYSTAWLDVTNDPIVISVPAVTDRYYSFEMVCMDADNFAYVGTRATGVEANSFLIAGPGWIGNVPDDVLDVLPRAWTPSIFLLGRTGVKDKTDVAAANAIQAQYRLTPLSVWTGQPTPPLGPVLVPYGVDYNHTDGAWKTINEAMTQNPPGVPPGINQDELLKLFATIGVGPNQDLDLQSQDTLNGLKLAAQDGLKMMRAILQGRGKPVHGWVIPPLDTGRAGQNSDFITRATVQSLGGICANDPAEAVYINVSTDQNGNPLTGGQSYTMTFADGAFPPYDDTKHGFWSVTIYDTATYNLVPGSNYTINSYSPDYQVRDAANGMTIVIQTDKPSTLPAGSYWLQAPPSPEAFYLILRVYVPGPTVSTTQTWLPPWIMLSP